MSQTHLHIILFRRIINTPKNLLFAATKQIYLNKILIHKIYLNKILIHNNLRPPSNTPF
jgi:hypothetical protein